MADVRFCTCPVHKPLPRSLPIEDSRKRTELLDVMGLDRPWAKGIMEELAWLRSKLSAYEAPDTMAIMHVLEQIKTELRTLASELAGLEAEVMNIRRLLPAPTWRS